MRGTAQPGRWARRRPGQWVACVAFWLLALAVLSFPGRLLLALAGTLVSPAFCGPVSQPPTVRQVQFLSGSGRRIVADLYIPAGPAAPHPGLLVSTPALGEGLRNRELRRTAGMVARLGYVVMLPFPDGKRIEGISPLDVADADAAIRCFLQLPEVDPARTVVAGLSYGGGPVLLAATGLPPEVSPSRFLTVGAYADLKAELRFVVTGEYRYRGTHGRREPSPFVRRILRRSLISLSAPADAPLLHAAFASEEPEALPAGLSPEGRVLGELLKARSSQRFDQLYPRLPERARRTLDSLSLLGRLGALRKPVYVLHPREDSFVPPDEALRLWRELPAAARGDLLVLPYLQHSLPIARPPVRSLGSYFQALLRGYYFLRRVLYPTPPPPRAVQTALLLIALGALLLCRPAKSQPRAGKCTTGGLISVGVRPGAPVPERLASSYTGPGYGSPGPV